MGVPAFFRWLSKKYSTVVVHCYEEEAEETNGIKKTIDTSAPNPNDIEFDNLYLDMNGIIHPCCHPENRPPPKDEDEMMLLIFEYIDRLFNIIRPRRLLYMAIDGVAPRAKMNQQRSRRFRSSKEGVEKYSKIQEVRERLKAQGIEVPVEKPKEADFDSNCITPGTPFMDRLSKCLNYYIHDKCNSDPGWKNIEVILSDASVPGEGEHKIMDYIRRQRASPDHDPNTHHILCGADADLIMLGLATHEPNFTIIREEFKPNQPRSCELCDQIGHTLEECTGGAKMKHGKFDELPDQVAAKTEFIFIRLCILREYLAKELLIPNLPFEYNFERALDDWIFMCFFVGNDFLPHLPSLEIREGAIDRLVQIYKTTVFRTGGFITDSGFVEMSRVHMILSELGKAEDNIFKERQMKEISFQRRQQQQHKRRKLFDDRPAYTPTGQFSPNQPSAYNMRVQAMNSNEEEAAEIEDNVRLWESGWKDRYYQVKFEVAPENIKFRHTVAEAYIEGLCWVLRYYYQGCCAWTWYYPYHYAPFASDFVTAKSLKISFAEETQPFKPLEQLMGVFPAASKNHLPCVWADLMCNPDSPIIDFYPIDFKIDLNGKKFAWQGVSLLPFVDEKRLLSALETVYPYLDSEEVRRNQRGDDRIYVSNSHPIYNYFIELNERGNKDEEFEFDPKLLHGLTGTVLLSELAVPPNETVLSPLPGLTPIFDNNVLCMKFRDPKFPNNFKFSAERLANAIEPPPTLGANDSGDRNWRPQIGMAPSIRRASLGDYGKKMMNHYTNNRGSFQGSNNNQFHQGYYNDQHYQGKYNNQIYQDTSNYQDQGNYGDRGNRSFHQQGSHDNRSHFIRNQSPYARNHQSFQGLSNQNYSSSGYQDQQVRGGYTPRRPYRHQNQRWNHYQQNKTD